MQRDFALIPNDKKTSMIVQEWMTVEEMAEYLHIGRSTAYELTRAKGFPAVKIGRLLRISHFDLLTWLHRQGRE